MCAKKAIEEHMWNVKNAGERVDKEELQFSHIYLGLLPQYEAEGWSLWQAAKRIGVPPHDRDERQIDCVKDVLDHDKPWDDTPYLIPTGLRLAWLLSLQPGQDESPEALAKMSPRSQANISHAQDLVEPAERGLNLTTATCRSHVPIYKRPAGVGLGSVSRGCGLMELY